MGKHYEAYLCGFQGLYYKSDSRSWETELVKEPITVCGVEIHPGDHTTLNDFFCRPIEYIGKENQSTAVFFIGSKEDILFPEYYYEPVAIITDNRLFKMYSNNGGRDFNYIKNEWK
jgi:hypothetical protein